MLAAGVEATGLAAVIRGRRAAKPPSCRGREDEARVRTPFRMQSQSLHAPRVAAVDAYRGSVMLLMLAEVLELRRVAKALPDSPFWQFLALHQSHAPWTGCTLHDL